MDLIAEPEPNTVPVPPISHASCPRLHQALLAAARAGREGTVKRLLNKGIHVDARDHHGRTGLMLAAHKGRTGTVDLLLRAGAQPTLYDDSGDDVMAWAIRGGEKFHGRGRVDRCDSLNECVIKLLLKNGADPNSSNTAGVTPLMKVCTHFGSVQLLELLISFGADVNAKDSYHNTPLCYVLMEKQCEGKCVPKVSQLLKAGSNPNHVNINMRTPLMLASYHSEAEVLEVLLEANANINATDSGGCTPLLFAVRSGDRSKVQVLLKNGADLEMASKDFGTPLMAAFSDLDHVCVGILLGHGASARFDRSPDLDRLWHVIMRHKIGVGKCRRHWAMECNAFLRCMEAMMKAGCSLGGIDKVHVQEFLGICIERGEYELVGMLLQLGVSPTRLPLGYCVRAGPNISPLHRAIANRQMEIVALFAHALFFHHTDVMELLHDAWVLQVLEAQFRMYSNRSPSILEEIRPQNWSLRTWSKLAVQKAVGFGEGRERRVRALPIPTRMQDEFLLRHIPSFEDLVS